jgi:hypothetical protein
MNVGIVVRGSGRKKQRGRKFAPQPLITAYELRYAPDEMDPDEMDLQQWRERASYLQTERATTLAAFTAVDAPPLWAHHCVEVLRPLSGPVELAQLIVADIRSGARRKWRGYPQERVDELRAILVAAKLTGEKITNAKLHHVNSPAVTRWMTR